MQSSPAHGVVDVGCPELVGCPEAVGCAGVVDGKQYGSWLFSHESGSGVLGCADALGERALIARTPTRSATTLSASIQPVRQRRDAPVDGRSAVAGPPDRRHGRTVGGVLTAIGQAPTIPLRISTISGANAANPYPHPADLNADFAFSTSPGSPLPIT